MERYRLLARHALEAEVWTPTLELLAASDLLNDREGGRGALKMLHVLGRVHARRGQRKAFEWRAGGLPEGESPVVDLAPFEAMRGLLEHYRSNPICTDAIMERCGLVGDRPGALGALKALVALELVTIVYPTKRVVEWYWGQMGTAERIYPRLRRKRYSCGPERFNPPDWDDWLDPL